MRGTGVRNIPLAVIPPLPLDGDCAIESDRQLKTQLVNAPQQTALQAALQAALQQQGTPARGRGVAWVTENPGKKVWLLRNVGGLTARRVDIDRKSLGGTRVDFMPRELPVDLPPGESIEITIEEGLGAPIAHEVHVFWAEEQHDTVTMPRLFSRPMPRTRCPPSGR